MEYWNLDEKTYSNDCCIYMQKHGFDKGIHPKFKVGDTITFFTGYNNDIPARARIKGINGNDIYVYNDSYWFPIQDDENRKINKS